MSLFEVRGPHSYDADSHILFDVSLRVDRHEIVLNNGHLPHEGTADDIRARPEILHRYLGI